MNKNPNSLPNKFMSIFTGRTKVVNQLVPAAAHGMAVQSSVSLTTSASDWLLKGGREAERRKARNLGAWQLMRMSEKEKIAFAKRMSILVKAGVPLLTALGMLKKQAHSKTASRVISHLHTQVEKGQSLSRSMSAYRKVFGDFAVNIIHIGEVSGTLDENLEYLAEELKKKQELKRKIISALVYPIFIVIATIGIAVLLTAYVFPKIIPVFESFRFELPWTTRLLINISYVMQHYWVYMISGIAVVIAIVVSLLKQPNIRLWVDRHILRVPLLGQLLQSYQITNFTRTLGLLLKSDVRIIDGLHIVGATIGNTAYQKKFNEIAESVARGKKISVAMENDEHLFPVGLAQMVSVGEATGNLSSSLMYLSEMHEDEMNNLTKNLSASIEPILMIFMGVLVGFIAISIITPIYGITQDLQP